MYMALDQTSSYHILMNANEIRACCVNCGEIGEIFLEPTSGGRDMATNPKRQVVYTSIEWPEGKERCEKGVSYAKK